MLQAGDKLYPRPGGVNRTHPNVDQTMRQAYRQANRADDVAIQLGGVF
jgi:hypothetical protein